MKHLRTTLLLLVAGLLMFDMGGLYACSILPSQKPTDRPANAPAATPPATPAPEQSTEPVVASSTIITDVATSINISMSAVLESLAAATAMVTPTAQTQDQVPTATRNNSTLPTPTPTPTPTPAISETLATQPPAPPLISSTETPATDPTERAFPSEQLVAILQQAGGTFGVIVYDPANGQLVYTQNEQTIFSAASLIKLPIAVTIYKQAEQDTLQLDDILTLRREDIVGGTGSLQYEPAGTVYSIRELTRRMIAESDNTAANMLISRAGGFDAINQVMRQLGATDTLLQRMLMDLEAIQAGRDNLTSPADMLLLLQLLEQGSIDGAPEILQAMAQTSDRQKIPALLPADATIHHKVGTLSGVEHDVGIVESPEGKRFIVVCMSSGLASNQTGISAIAEASRLVYDTMTQPQAQASSDSDASTPAAQSTPTYSFPVRAAWVEYTPYHHDYPATDIFCPVGSEFLATTNGVVDFVNRVDRWDPTTDRPADRGGIMLAIVGDDGWRYYASHLSGIAEGIEPGVRVTTGQLLGWTGRSGNARHTDPHVHYGISHPTTPEDWQVRRGEIPPYEYLQAWARGEHKTPGR